MPIWKPATIYPCSSGIPGSLRFRSSILSAGPQSSFEGLRLRALKSHHYLIRRIAVAVQQGNTAGILGTFNMGPTSGPFCLYSLVVAVCCHTVIIACLMSVTLAVAIS